MHSVPNCVIAMLPPADGRRLASICSTVDLHPGDLLQAAGRRGAYVYFPTGALVGLLTGMRHAQPVQLAMVGHEGLVGGEPAATPQPAPMTSVVQEAGTALRARVEDFQALMRLSEPLSAAALRHEGLLLRQVVHSAACLHSHEVAPRLARWLLMTQQRANSRHFSATQSYLAGMLGVRRPGVTAAARTLQHGGLIDYSRGALTVLDRNGLRAAACTCQATDRLLYAALLKPAPAEPPMASHAVSLSQA